MQHSQLAYEKAILRFIALVALKKTHTLETVCFVQLLKESCNEILKDISVINARKATNVISINLGGGDRDSVASLCRALSGKKWRGGLCRVQTSPLPFAVRVAARDLKGRAHKPPHHTNAFTLLNGGKYTGSSIRVVCRRFSGDSFRTPPAEGVPGDHELHGHPAEGPGEGIASSLEACGMLTREESEGRVKLVYNGAFVCTPEMFLVMR